ncbi:MAG: hypothetical protein JWL88_668 [Parcubacteria group bacterium]|nr:hypothetical protein [Parcubacteria group bacterium]
MKKFFVLFGVPAGTMQGWVASTDEATRKEQSADLMQKWQEWMTAHESVILDKGLPIGKTKRVDANGVADTKNELNWYLVVEAESHEAAAEMFVGHPHFMIPTAYIEVMDASHTGM